MDAFRKRWASPQMGVGEGIQTPSLPPTPPSLLCSGEGPILVHKFRARVHLRKIEFLSEKWGAPQDSNAVLFPKPLLLPRHIGMPSIESETVSNKFVPSQGFTPRSWVQLWSNNAPISSKKWLKKYAEPRKSNEIAYLGLSST
jgi:hypothetical protein